MMSNNNLGFSPHPSAAGLIQKCQTDCWRTSLTVMNSKMLLPIHHQRLPLHLYTPVTKLFLQHRQKCLVHSIRETKNREPIHDPQKRQGQQALPGYPSLCVRDSNFTSPDCLVSTSEFNRRNGGEISSSDLSSLPLLLFVLLLKLVAMICKYTI